MTKDLVIEKLNYQKAEKIIIKPVTWKTMEERRHIGWLDYLLGFKQN